MSDVKLRYVLGSARYANADNLTSNIKINLPLSHQLLGDDNIIELVSLVQRYDKERQASPIHRVYGRLGFITTNELTDYNMSTLVLSDPVIPIHNYNLQLLYPSSSTTDITLKDFSCGDFDLSCSYYDTTVDCDSHKIYHGLPFTNSNTILYNGKHSMVLQTYAHKYGNNINPDDYVYVIPGKGGTSNPLYGINRVSNTQLDDGTQNVLILDTLTTGHFAGSYKKIVSPSDNDIKFLNTIGCHLYITSTTVNELFIRTVQRHNVVVGDYVDLRKNKKISIFFDRYNGIHKVNRIITEFIYVCEFPKHLLTTAFYVSSINQMTPVLFPYKYRVLDGDPSEYYLRKFKVLVAGDNTTNIREVDYYLQQLYMSNTIWKNVDPLPYFNCNTQKQSGSDDDRITSFVFNRDVDISNYVDNLGRPLSELYLGVIKRKNRNSFNSLITNFQGSLLYSGITNFYNPLILPTYTNPSIKAPLNYFSITQFNDAGLNIGYEYYGDLCEFSINTLDEVVLDPLQFRIGKIVGGHHVEGYVYEPFKKIELRNLSTDIEEVLNTESVYPSYALPYHRTFRWREMNPYGYKEIIESGVRVVDNPFVNGAHYDFSDSAFYLRRQNKNPDNKFTITITPYVTSC